MEEGVSVGGEEATMTTHQSTLAHAKVSVTGVTGPCHSYRKRGR
jgi:hypothetical protein